MPDLPAVFRETIFLCTVPSEGWPREFAIITACDPEGAVADQEDNERATEKLCIQLKALKVWHWPVTGASPNLAHHEHGFAARLSLEEARTLAEEYAQLGFFWVVGDEVILYSRDGQSGEVICSWAARLRFPPRIARFLATSVESRKDQLWEDAEGYGLWVRYEDAPDLKKAARDRAVRESIAGNTSDASRAAALRDGAKLTQKESEDWRLRWMQAQFIDNDADRIPGYALVRVNDLAGNRGCALLLRTGYSFTKIQTWVESAFPTIAAARDHMNRYGLTD